MNKVLLFLMCMLVIACNNNSSKGQIDSDSTEFYRQMLEAYCVAHFEESYKEFTYREGSLRVTSAQWHDDSISVIGTFSFDKKIKKVIDIIPGANDLPLVKDVGTYDNREFRAEIIDLGDDNYKICNMRRQSTSKPSKWKKMVETTIHFEGNK